MGCFCGIDDEETEKHWSPTKSILKRRHAKHNSRTKCDECMTSQVLYSYIYKNKLNRFISADSSRKLFAVLPPPPYYIVANPVIFWIQASSVQRCLWGEGRGGACVKPHRRKFVPVIVHLVIHRWAPAPERPICANPGLKFCSFFIYLPIHCLESHILFWHFCILEQRGNSIFLSSS